MSKIEEKQFGRKTGGYPKRIAHFIMASADFEQGFSNFHSNYIICDRIEIEKEFSLATLEGGGVLAVEVGVGGIGSNFSGFDFIKSLPSGAVVDQMWQRAVLALCSCQVVIC